ncbi:right-handed parallel beta-helix repeat-containing protein [Myxococcus sp. K15C18031901]|uniref:right-handed parallel beta-helix repeat-containing protein n=1 Tax=Myxococcus dinghuensis TaxID=2906761 RepID=UPI0020A734A4|nr:right-handed parallel beta-helix repeat-containing protein [Myxococcus dinghuensis]MCP3100174.1 right-handed parallel beta-helix repeat-containing protein [Myxococcus dinghuensis]
MSTPGSARSRATGLAALPALLCLLFSASASAQATRTWVSGVGDDVNPCSRTAPCKTFAGAISKTAPNGEIDALDPGGYGTVTITKSIVIDGGPYAGGVLFSGTHGIIVNAPGGTVILRNLGIAGIGAGLDGIRILAASKVQVENCSIQGFTGSGINVLPSAGTVQLVVRNTTVNGAFAKAPTSADETTGGIQVASGGAVVQNSQLASGLVGLNVLNGARVTVTDTSVMGHSDQGVLAVGGAQVTLERAVVAQNGAGIKAEAPAQVRISDTLVGQNTGLGLDGPVVSFGNNRVAAGNGMDGAPSTTLPQN